MKLMEAIRTPTSRHWPVWFARFNLAAAQLQMNGMNGNPEQPARSPSAAIDISANFAISSSFRVIYD
jgi:hypothetical protein